MFEQSVPKTRIIKAVELTIDGENPDDRKQFNKKRMVTALSLILIVSTFLTAFIVQMKNEGDSVGGLKCFASYEEIRSFVKARTDEIRGSLFYRFSTPSADG